MYNVTGMESVIKSFLLSKAFVCDKDVKSYQLPGMWTGHMVDCRESDTQIYTFASAAEATLQLYNIWITIRFESTEQITSKGTTQAYIIRYTLCIRSTDLTPFRLPRCSRHYYTIHVDSQRTASQRESLVTTNSQASITEMARGYDYMVINQLSHAQGN